MGVVYRPDGAHPVRGYVFPFEPATTRFFLFFVSLLFHSAPFIVR